MPSPDVIDMDENGKYWYDTASGAYILNQTDVEPTEIMRALTQQHPEVAALVKWSYSLASTQMRKGGLFERDRYVTPPRIFDQFDVARTAVENDDVVGGVLETLESLAFSRMAFEVEDQDEEDVWNQVAADLDLDSRIREMWRELFTVSQLYVSIYWGVRDYKVRGKTPKGVQRKKVFNQLKVPIGLTILDPKKVAPVGNFMFNQEKLVYVADVYEAAVFNRVLNNEISDPIVEQMILQPFVPTEKERLWMADIGIPGDMPYLYLLNPQNVFRHTATRPQFQHMASVRLKGIFDLLDLKAQLKEMDRAHLLGASNYILLVKKGTDKIPATPAEINNLTGQVKMQARVPVIVGDHRLSIEIITPKMDVILNQMKYDTIDSRIQSRLLQMFINTGHISRGDDHTKLARVIAMGIESRRAMLKRTLEKFMIKPTMYFNKDLTALPTLAFHPKRISLDFDAALAAYLIDLRDRREISRETLLSEFDYSEEEEAVKMQREAELYDDIFATQVPYNGAPANQPPSGVTPASDQNSTEGTKAENTGTQSAKTQTASKPKPSAPPSSTTGRSGGRNRAGNRTPGTKKSGGAAPGNPKQGKTKEQQR